MNMSGQHPEARLRVAIRGAVQGVGFRPFVYRLATELHLRGWVSNNTAGVFIEVEGARTALDEFLLRLGAEKPPRAAIHSLESSLLEPADFATFEIRESDAGGERTAIVLPDIATCDDCLREIFDPADRRHLYPFTNCTNCGPRYSIIQALPYDRSNTTMSCFTMCARCRDEYENPLDRRFHAQPNACPACGPHVRLLEPDGTESAEHHDAILRAAQAIRDGRIVAVKGLGGFHLVVDARNDDAVLRLRGRKHREEKPLALMVPTLDAAKRECIVSALEERTLASPESPIVLLQRATLLSQATVIAPSVAPGNPFLGVMLPYTPLHHILMHELGFPVVATSGNLSDEPICTDENEALERLAGIADLFLVHNRPIERHVDDSITRVQLGRELMLRRARGYAPLPVPVGRNLPPVLAFGAHLKNTVAAIAGGNAFVSQHVGDLDTEASFTTFQQTAKSLSALYEVEPRTVACDAHPDYASTRFARALGQAVIAVPHHFAHVVACMAENELEGEVLGVSWDGTGLGLDGTVWGGEFLLATRTGFRRVAHFRTFRLAGGDKAIKEPRRTAAGLLFEISGVGVFDPGDHAPIRAFDGRERELIWKMLESGINSPLTSSVGRLFDACAALAGLRQVVRFEGQAAMELEFAAAETETGDAYPLRFEMRDAPAEETDWPASYSAAAARLMVVDWEPMFRQIITDVRTGEATGVIAAKFHNTLAQSIVEVARQAGQSRVVLTGGCFQNRRLTEQAVRRLEQAGLRPYWHQRIPPNDGGIALGQAVVAANLSKKE